MMWFNSMQREKPSWTQVLHGCRQLVS